MATRRRIDWEGLRWKFSDSVDYVLDRKKRFAALLVGSVLSVGAYDRATSPEFQQELQRRSQEIAAKDRQLQQFADHAQVRGPGQGAIPVGALNYMFDFNTQAVTISGEGGKQDVSFDKVFGGDLAKKVKATICADSARRDKFGLHYCQ